jgi:ferredoxin
LHQSKYRLRPRRFLLPSTSLLARKIYGRRCEQISGKRCHLCRETAPANFKRNDDGGHSFVYKQAESPEEEALCKEAMEGCPVEAIGDNGA